MTKHIFVTGGVASSLGKGLTASSLGRLLKSRGLRVTMQKLDPYLNVDPGTMNPFEHGEVFVTDDGGETDLDLGHYERFIDEPLSRDSNATTVVEVTGDDRTTELARMLSGTPDSEAARDHARELLAPPATTPTRSRAKAKPKPKPKAGGKTPRPR